MKHVLMSKFQGEFKFEQKLLILSLFGKFIAWIFDASQTRIYSGKDVIELLQQKEFYYTCLNIFPGVSQEEVDEMFRYSCELITMKSMRACVEEGGWREIILSNGRFIYVNVIRKRIQWRKPFEEKSFRDFSTCDIDTFIAVVLQQNLLLRG